MVTVSNYHINSAISQGFPPSEMTKINKSVLLKFAIILVLPFQNNPKGLDLSYDRSRVLGLFWKEKTNSASRRDTVLPELHIIIR